MAFVSLPGLTGKVYVPEQQTENKKKHPCKDCCFCQMCSENRCQLCIGQRHQIQEALPCQRKDCTCSKPDKD